MDNGHALVRTSPKGGPFIGACMKCGMENLPITATGKPCVNPADMPQKETLILAVKGLDQ